MNSPSHRNAGSRGHTLLEMLLVTLILGILMLLILPVIGKAKAQAKRASCVSNLHQVGLAYHEFAHDHHDQFPWQVSTNEGGTLEFSQAGFAMSSDFFFAFRHFQALSNSLLTPRLYICPADTRTNADYFHALRNHNLSYFVGLNAEYSRPASILAGDRNITSDGFASGSILRVSPGAPAGWSSGCHEFKGNLLFADAHVAQANNEELASAIQNAGTPVISLLPPITPPTGTEIPVAAEPTVVATLQRFFDNAPGPQGGNSGGGNPGATPNPTPLPPANQPNARPPDVPKPIAAAPAAKPPAPGAAAPRPVARANAATNPAPAIAAVDDAAKKAAQAGTPVKDPSAKPGAGSSTDYTFNFYFLLFQPGQHFWLWLMILLLTVTAAFLLGWHLYRSRAKKRLASASPAPRIA